MGTLIHQSTSDLTNFCHFLVPKAPPCNLLCNGLLLMRGTVLYSESTRRIRRISLVISHWQIVRFLPPGCCARMSSQRGNQYIFVRVHGTFSFALISTSLWYKTKVMSMLQYFGDIVTLFFCHQSTLGSSKPIFYQRYLRRTHHQLSGFL